MNVTVGLNQNLFFNMSADFPQSVNYTIFLNNISVVSGTIPANTVAYKIIKYNVTNIPTGTYQPSVKLSTLSSQLKYNAVTKILPKQSFTFLGYSNHTSFFNRAGVLDIKVWDNGNTPLNVTWTLPSASGVSFSLVYQESFSLKPSQVFSIPMNITLASVFSKQLNFSFVSVYQNTSLTKYYVTQLFSPIINMSFFDNIITAGNDNTSIYKVQITNGNNLPVNTTFQFLLDIDGNNFYYNKSYLISTSTTQVNITLPKSYVLAVNVYYSSQNGSITKQQIFSQAPPSSASSSVLLDIIYVVVLIIGIAALLLLHLRFNRKNS
jgi:hypothetical protein